MRRLFAAVVLALLTAPIWPSSAQPTRTAGNSVAAPLLIRDQTDIEGVGCGVPSSWTLRLPARAFAVSVRKPKVGARDLDAKITDIAVQAGAIKFTAVADSQDICDPNASEIPPAQRHWTAFVPLEVRFKRLDTVAVRIDWARGGYRVRPRVVVFGFSDIFPRAVNIRWRSFGGRKAIGFGIFRYPRSTCPSGRCGAPDGQRVRVELTLPGYCPGQNVFFVGAPVGRFVFYGELAAINLRKLGVLRPGTKFVAYHPDCGSYGAHPIRIR
jgi:hypothetical protein